MPGPYNTAAEVDVLIEALQHITHGTYEGHYEQEVRSGEYHAVDWKPDWEKYFRL